jgi:hypothetical protein
MKLPGMKWHWTAELTPKVHKGKKREEKAKQKKTLNADGADNIFSKWKAGCLWVHECGQKYWFTYKLNNVKNEKLMVFEVWVPLKKLSPFSISPLALQCPSHREAGPDKPDTLIINNPRYCYERERDDAEGWFLEENLTHFPLVIWFLFWPVAWCKNAGSAPNELLFWEVIEAVRHSPHVTCPHLLLYIVSFWEIWNPRVRVQLTSKNGYVCKSSRLFLTLWRLRARARWDRWHKSS